MRGDFRLPLAGMCVALAAVVLCAALAPAFAKGVPAPDEVVGAPETGARGITESVADIMSRDRLVPGSDAVTLASDGPPALPQTAGTSFKAIGLSESTFIPPDTAGDVGATQILVHTNGRVRVFAKTGAPGALNVTALSFWSSVANGSQPVFPQVRYDRLSGRFILLAVNSTKPNNRVMIAVQTTPGTITAASSFTFYQFDQQSGGGSGDNSRVCDSPRLGIDNSALYVGCNMNSTSGNLTRITVYVVRKSSVIPAPGTLVVTAFRDISNGTNGPGPHSPIGVDNDDPQATEGYFIGADIGSSSVLQLRRVSTPGGTPTLSGNLTLSVPATASPILQPAWNSAVNLEAGDDRVTRASIHKNKVTGVTTLWASQSSEVDATCAGAVGGGRNGARWYEIAGSSPTTADPLGGTPTLVQSGTLCDPTDETPKGYIYPSAVGTGQGHMAMGSTVAAATLFAGAAAAGRLRFDPSGATQAQTTIQSGLASYTFVTAGKNLWGGYSFSDVDPTDDQTVWTFQEYADTPANNWAVRAVQLRAPPPPSLSGLQALLCAGVAASPVTLTATADAPVAGAEFFDPGPDTGGPGYASHLSATATGGLTVNGAPSIVLPASPATQPVLAVTLSLNTTAATAGLKNITIRNPDLQSSVGTGIVRVDAPVTPVATNSGPICEGATLTLGVTAVPFATYAWSGPNGFTSSLQSPTIPNVSLAAGGTYTVTFSGLGCTLPAAMTTVTVLANDQSCDDGNACTASACSAGVCQAGSPVVCNDSNICTADSCDPATGCVFTDTTAVTCADGNVCTDDACDPVTGCFHPNNTLACNDGDACTSGDLCGGGSCLPGGPVTCDDGNGCTDDSCSPATGCVFTNNAAPCDDGNACTSGDACGAGSCHAGAPVVCDDGNPCTDDSCNPATGCVFTNNTAPCDDGSACTSGDTCGAGSCHAGAPVVCDDGNGCTDDSCDPVTGCVHVNNTAPCSDGSLCTVGDVCGQGSCQPGPPPVCDDNNVCTEDTCRPTIGCFYDDISFLTCNDGNACTDDACDPTTGCFHTNNIEVCDDGNACTANDTCSGGVCQPGNTFTCNDGDLCTDDSCDPRYGCVFFDNSASCNDGNPCTTDACDPASGCFHTNNTEVCDDGNACTAGDVCGGGSCQPGAPVSCDDGNLCTADSCNPASGCVHTDVSSSCNDGNACTADSCDPATGCVFTDTSASCTDSNPCTNDSCNPATGCVFTNNTAPCDDANACTTGDTCGGGTCHAGTAISCNDGNGCTTDSCNPATGCGHANNTLPCSDGNACTTGDTCGGGSCQPGSATVCNDSNACTTDSCNPATGCVFTNNSASCNDGNVCTADSCSPATGCVHTNVTGACTDGTACTSGDTCVAGACQGTPITCNDNNLCTADSCNPATGCVFTDITASCNDNNPCTADSCMPNQGCKHQNTNGSCSDGNACTTGDFCQGGVCRSGSAVVCNDNSVCTADSCSVATGCVFTDTTATQCNDSNPCTNDLCNAATGCFHSNNTSSCSDGNACTTGDVCGGGTCHAGGATVCNDSNPCTNDSCSPATGCVFANNTSTCSDGNACTTGDVCGGGTCHAGGATVCNDSNPCTDDSCNPATGCVFANNTNTCSDGNACTTGDACGGGSCQPGAPIVCDDTNVCTTDSCNPLTGCVFTNNTVACDDGDACTQEDACSGGACAGVPTSASEVLGLALSGRVTTTLSWTTGPPGAVYDVASSTLSDLAAAGVAGATCLVNDEPTTSFVDPQPSPSPGAGYYYLIRAQSACGTGSYGNSSANVPRVPATDCP